MVGAAEGGGVVCELGDVRGGVFCVGWAMGGLWGLWGLGGGVFFGGWEVKEKGG